MPKLLGITPEYGIPSAEDGLLIESLTFSWNGEWYDQKDHRGRLQGKLLVDESMSVSMNGAVPLGDQSTIKAGATLALANVVPDLWCEKPEATTTVVDSISRSMSNSDAQKLDVGATILAFGSGE